MKKLALLAVSTLLLASLSAQAQNMRVRGTITSLDGDMLSVKTREGKDVKIQLAPDAQVATTKKVPASEFKPGSYVGVTSVKGPDGKAVGDLGDHAAGVGAVVRAGAFDEQRGHHFTFSKATLPLNSGTRTTAPGWLTAAGAAPCGSCSLHDTVSLPPFTLTPVTSTR